MSETPPGDTGRLTLRYAPVDDADQSEVSLPGYLDAVPSIIAPGDLFTVPVSALEDSPDGRVLPGPFVIVDAPALHVVTPPDATIAELRAMLPEDVRDDCPTGPKRAVVEYVEAYLRDHPTPPGPSGDDTLDPDPEV